MNCDVRQYGAVGDGVTMNTQSIQKAIDDCFLAGGGRVVIPCGIYLTGSIRIRSGVQFYLESGAILKGSRRAEDYFAYRDDKIEPVTLEEVDDDCGVLHTSDLSDALDDILGFCIF